MKIQLGIAVLYACPGLTAKEAAEAAREFYFQAFDITNKGGLFQVALPDGRTGQGRTLGEAYHDARNYVPYGS